jgi:glutamine amidotransferase-like uncharacterized protein
VIAVEDARSLKFFPGSSRGNKAQNVWQSETIQRTEDFSRRVKEKLG